ncbi:MAG: glycogen debranching protein GlgX [Actinomycetota bacterium]
MPSSESIFDIGYRRTETGGMIRVWSANATTMSLTVWSEKDPEWPDESLTMSAGDDHVWSVESELLVPGALYSIHAGGPEGPNHVFDPENALLDPYARGVVRTDSGDFRSVIVDGTFDWGGVEKPHTPLSETVIYEAHAKGLTALHPDIPEHLRGTYAGIAHPATINHLKSLGVTAIELLPVHHFISEERLRKQGLDNYWGYNSLAYFAPHPAYATRESIAAGRDAVLTEFKGMVRLLHEAGIEVILDVVYNHTAEGGFGGPSLSFRGLDNANYYRQTELGEYIDTTGCSNTLNTSVPAVAQLVVDSLRFWADECQVDGFRFDLMASLGRGANHEFSPEHPLLHAIVSDPVLSTTKLIAEPWDTGMGGWQVGNFPAGYQEWNDGYRDTVREFWLHDIAEARAWTVTPQGVGKLASALSGSVGTFGAERSPLASVNFITAHDGFTLADLVSFDQKHNKANGEDNRDGTDHNISFNFGHEGFSHEESVIVDRRRAMRSLLGTLFTSAGIPMLTAGDEMGRTQHGNNNAYCHDSALTWVSWDLADWQQAHLESTTRLLQIRRDNPALRPEGGIFPSMEISPAGRPRQARTPKDAWTVDWYAEDGTLMTFDNWTDSTERTLQYLAGTPAVESERNRVLVLIHGLENSVEVSLPKRTDVNEYEILWDSSHAAAPASRTYSPGEVLAIGPTTVMIFAVR